MDKSGIFLALVLSLIGGVAEAGPQPCEAGLESYKKTLHPYVRSKCVACHDMPATGPIQGPGHSVADPNVSYRKMLRYLDKDPVERSTLVEFGGNGHCRDYGVDCGVTAVELLPVVRRWLDEGQTSCGVGRATTPMAIPLDLPSRETGFRAIEIPLASLGARTATARLRIDAQLFSPADSGQPGAYRFQRPRFVLVGSETLRVRGLKIWINGRWDPRNTSFLSINQVVNGKSEGRVKTEGASFPTLSTNSQIVLREKTEGDTISVSFEELEPVRPAKCAELAMFRETVLPTVEFRDCRGCHGASSTMANARQSLFVSDNEAEICDEFLIRTGAVSPAQTVLLGFGAGLFGGHFPSLPFADERDAFANWIAKERLTPGSMSESEF